MAYVYVQLHIHINVFSNGSMPTGFKFTELHALTLAACSYALLLHIISIMKMKNSYYTYTHLAAAAYTYYRTLNQEDSLKRRGKQSDWRKIRRRRERVLRLCA